MKYFFGRLSCFWWISKFFFQVQLGVVHFFQVLLKHSQAGAHSINGLWCMLGTPGLQIYNDNAFEDNFPGAQDAPRGLSDLFCLPILNEMQDLFQPWRHGPLLRDLGAIWTCSNFTPKS